jgi:UDP-N-acetyl-D-mannosaminuronate dehydrogenase
MTEIPKRPVSPLAAAMMTVVTARREIAAAIEAFIAETGLAFSSNTVDLEEGDASFKCVLTYTDEWPAPSHPELVAIEAAIRPVLKKWGVEFLVVVENVLRVVRVGE